MTKKSLHSGQSSSVYLVMQVVDKKTGEVMVIKELVRFSKEAQEGFLKEVGHITGNVFCQCCSLWIVALGREVR